MSHSLTGFRVPLGDEPSLSRALRTIPDSSLEAEGGQVTVHPPPGTAPGHAGEHSTPIE